MRTHVPHSGTVFLTCMLVLALFMVGRKFIITAVTEMASTNDDFLSFTSLVPLCGKHHSMIYIAGR